MGDQFFLADWPQIVGLFLNNIINHDKDFGFNALRCIELYECSSVLCFINCIKFASLR